MGLTIWLRMLNNAKHRSAIYLKFEGRLFFFSLSMLGLQSKVSINSTIKENLLLYYRKFSAFVVAVVIEHVLTTESDSQRKTACNRNRELWNTIIRVSKQAIKCHSFHLRYKPSLLDRNYDDPLSIYSRFFVITI